jgi:hypothetical protein
MMEIFLPQQHTIYRTLYKKSNEQTKRLLYTRDKYILPFNKRII